MRKFLLAALIGIPALSLAQTDDVTRIQTAYQNLRNFPAVQIQVDAARQNGSVSTSSSETINWVWDPSGTEPNSSKIAAVDYVNGSEVAQLVADGETIFAYLPAQRGYMAHHYALTSGTATSDYRMDLLQHFDSLSNLRGNYAARLLQEVFGADLATYSPWSSGTMTEVTNDTGPQTDPITGRTYQPDANNDFVMYENTGNVNHSIVFQRTSVAMPDGTTQWVISNVFVAESDTTNPHVTKTLQLILGITPLTTAPDVTFSFVPPAGVKVLQSTNSNG